MREIKFRGKTSFGEWKYGSLLQSEIDINELNVVCEIHERFANDLSISRCFVDPKSVGQYTGLKDRNGKEIYEGDILSGHSDGNVKVVWKDACWQCIFDDEANIGLDEMCIWFGNNACVIGNIYENSELLKS